MVSTRSILATGLLVLASLLSTGCTLGAKVATDIENASMRRSSERYAALLNKHVQTLQAHNDPLGDYLYALKQSHASRYYVPNPQGITALYEKAAVNGSMDAKILLALQVATSEEIPGRFGGGRVPSVRNLKPETEAALSQLLLLLQQQCYAQDYQYGQSDIVLSSFSVAKYIWPSFRDGQHTYSENGPLILTVPKDPERQKLWEDIDRNCHLPKDQLVTP